MEVCTKSVQTPGTIIVEVIFYLIELVMNRLINVKVGSWQI